MLNGVLIRPPIVPGVRVGHDLRRGADLVEWLVRGVSAKAARENNTIVDVDTAKVHIHISVACPHGAVDGRVTVERRSTVYPRRRPHCVMTTTELRVNVKLAG